MATVRSLGVHTPSALPFLISEGILPKDPQETQYRWETYFDSEALGFEELLTTDYCVVWSRGGVVKQLFNFQVEQQTVRHAVLTWFPSTEEARARESDTREENPYKRSKFNSAREERNPKVGVEGGYRALVIFLRLQAHVYFVTGASYVVNLPFEIERAFPAPRGVILQRKLSPQMVPATPIPPSAPNNSFFSPFSTRRSQPGSSLRVEQPFPSQDDQDTQIWPGLDFSLLRGSSAPAVDDSPRHYSFTDPLAEMGPIVQYASSQTQGSLTAGRFNDHITVSLDKDEEILYVSRHNELSDQDTSLDTPLILVVTANYVKRIFSSWYGSYLSSKPLSTLFAGRTRAVSGIKARRRSSFMTTGTNTPLPRGRESIRESFGAQSRSRTRPPSLSGSQLQYSQGSNSAEDVLASQLDPDYETRQPAKESRRVSSLLSRAELSTSFDRNAFRDLATQSGARESLGSHARRGHSLGASHDRYSFGQPGSKSRMRASTPGSFSRQSVHDASETHTLLSQSLSEDLQDDEELDYIAGYPNSDDLNLHMLNDGLRKEFFLSKFAEVSMDNPARSMPSSQQSDAGGVSIPVPLYFPRSNIRQRVNLLYADSLATSIYASIPITMRAQEETGGADESYLQKRLPRVFIIQSPRFGTEKYACGRQFSIHIMNYAALEHIQLEIDVALLRVASALGSRRTFKPSKSSTRCVAVPSLKSISHQSSILDILKISDQVADRVVCLKTGTRGNPAVWVYGTWCPELATRLQLSRLRVFNSTSLCIDTAPMLSSPRTAGTHRTIAPPDEIRRLEHPGPNGTFDLIGGDGEYHRTQIQVSCTSRSVSQTLSLCYFIFPPWLGEWLYSTWWHRWKAENDGPSRDWNALVQMLLLLPLSLDESRAPPKSKTRHSKASSRSSISKPLGISEEDSAWDRMWKMETASGRLGFLDSPAWSWLTQAVPARGESLDASPLKDPEAMEPAFNKILRKAQLFVASEEGSHITRQLRQSKEVTTASIRRLLIALHLLREEHKLDIFSPRSNFDLCPVIAQIGRWLGWPGWDWKGQHYYGLELAGVERLVFDDLTISACSTPPPENLQEPPAIFAWLESAISSNWTTRFPDLSAVFSLSASPLGYSPRQVESFASVMTPRTAALSKYVRFLQNADNDASQLVEAMTACGITSKMLESFPEAVSAIFQEFIVRCRTNPPTTWGPDQLQLVSREDLNLMHDESPRLGSSSGPLVRHSRDGPPMEALADIAQHFIPVTRRDIHTIMHAVEPEASSVFSMLKSDSVSALIFHEDKRLITALRMIEPSVMHEVDCPTDPSWTGAQILEVQREVAQLTMLRTFSLAPGLGMARFNSRRPLLTEKYQLSGYNVHIRFRQLRDVYQVDRTAYTEDKYGWAWFHAGAAAGLAISRKAQGIDTSWIVFNKPPEPHNRHAGLLLGLGLNGHLKNIARWLAFKYLTPKHTMTSVGLLLGMSASYLGTMDTLVTRLLSVHVTRMLPPGAAELNLSPLAQTTGVMGIGLLYYNTQHRRMSEIMLSEIESIEKDDTSDGSDPIRDESYRLAAGFALGYINLGKGKDLQGLRDMRIIERLLSIAVGPKPVDLVHILDQATAGATIALGLVFLKTGNKAVANKVDVPDTLPQFDFIRPDILLLRTLSKHLILWDGIRADGDWIVKNLPKAFREHMPMSGIKDLNSRLLPFYNILAGLLWSISLRFAGSGDASVRDLLIGYHDEFLRIFRLPAVRYDARLTRNTVRNCQDLLALAAATVMAGTGDLEVMRRLRRLHGRVNAETPFGSHLAAHMGLGALFLGGGTWTFGTSNLAIASLVVAFYPLFPMDPMDNKAHLQALRHLWAFAAEPRCIVIRDLDADRMIRMTVRITMRDGTTRDISAPALLPGLEEIAKVETLNDEYWPVVLDFEKNPHHLAAFKSNQTLHVRRRPPHLVSPIEFINTFVALNQARLDPPERKMWEWIFELPAFNYFEKAVDFGLILPRGQWTLDNKSTPVDDGLALLNAARGNKRDRLWNLRVLFQWVEYLQASEDVKIRWFGKLFVERLKAVVEERSRAADGEVGLGGRIEELR